MSIRNYKTLIFDCDGVILDSNKVKTDAFYQAALPFGKQAAECLVDYHVRHGGVSRYHKFEYLLSDIVAKNAVGPNLSMLLQHYGELTTSGLKLCSLAAGLNTLREQTKSSKWLMVSGSDQSELRGVCTDRGIDRLFDGGIFGSPDNKEIILDRETRASNITFPGVFLGDSSYDHRAALSVGLDFIFVSGWSELPDWRDFVSLRELNSVPAVGDLIEYGEST